jgi:hypothetical protein
MAVAAMPAWAVAEPLFAVVYGERSKVIRRKIMREGDPDNSGVLRAVGNLAPGEAIALFSCLFFPPHKRHVEDLQPYIGEPLHDGRCCIVAEDGQVLGVVMADPDIDTVPQGRLVLESEMAIA